MAVTFSRELVLLPVLRWFEERQSLRIIERGNHPPPSASVQECIPRPDLLKKLSSVLTPTAAPEQFFLICGEQGTGKTTGVLQACEMVEGGGGQRGGGVVYVMVQNDMPKKLAVNLGRAFGYHFHQVRLIDLLVSKREWELQPHSLQDDAVDEALKKLAKLAARYKKKHGVGIVLVLDGADRLAEVKHAQEQLERLIQFAKDQADSGCIKVVFVSSVGAGTRFIRGAFAHARGCSLQR